MNENSLREEKVQRRSKPGIDVAARKVIRKIFEPIADFALNCGLSVNDVHSIFEQAAVRHVAARQIDHARRVNVSGISATTGLSRAEISKVLQRDWSPNDSVPDRGQKVTNRILAAWQSDPKFLMANGGRANLKLYGRGPTFESLVNTYGRGIPIRAILDELLCIDAIELKPGQKISPKSLVAVDRRLTHRNISTFGNLVSNVLSSNLRSLRAFDSPMVVKRVSDIQLSTRDELLLRTVAAAKARALLIELQQMMTSKRERAFSCNPSTPVQLAVTIVLSEKIPKRALKDTKKRRNFRRG